MSEKEKEETIEKLEERIKELKEQYEFAELCLTCSILVDIYKMKVMQSLEEEGDVDMDVVNDWKKKADHYKQLEEETISKIDTNKFLERIN